jgi:DNA topoisomerase-1
MSKSLVIVESPTKAKTLKKYLGNGYEVLPTLGHIKDLPKTSLGVDVDNNFEANYVTIKGKNKVIKSIKESSKEVDKIYLGSDPDREGEAIAWHISEILGKKAKSYRILLHEITKEKVKKAIEEASSLNKNKYEAQIARRVLDRLVGYKLSPLLWQKIQRGLSAGRVQSVTVKIICDREREIKSFIPEEYWTIEVVLKTDKNEEFIARLIKINDEKPDIKQEASAKSICDELNIQNFIISDIVKKEKRRKPPPPYITSTLQQDGSRRLHFSAKRTMQLAQKLYEGIEVNNELVGLITYMRTDSLRITSEALDSVRKYINETYSEKFVPKEPNLFKNKKHIQDAHEAIRPTTFSLTPEKLKTCLSEDEFLLYELIWKRFVASQMADALFDSTQIDIKADKYLFRANGSVLKFSGFLELYKEADEKEGEAVLPELTMDSKLTKEKIIPAQHFTEPPPRFNESSLIAFLEENGIGRPSTYATIISNIQEKKYINRDNGKFIPNEIGFLVTDMLGTHFSDILNIQFTAKMEDELDLIEEGKKNYVNSLREFYDVFSQKLNTANLNLKNLRKEPEKTDIKCDKCGNEMVIKWGRNGKFLACSNFPACKNARDFEKNENGEIKIKEAKTTDIKCDKCGSPMVVKSGRFGEFLACSKYPECKSTKAISTEVKCPNEGCVGELVQKRSKFNKIFYACNQYPNCKFAIWYKPIPEKCPLCNHPFLVEKKIKDKTQIACINKECNYTK